MREQSVSNYCFTSKQNKQKRSTLAIHCYTSAARMSTTKVSFKKVKRRHLLYTIEVSKFGSRLKWVPYFYSTPVPSSPNSPAAHCSSSAPFSQSRSPSHRHDNETHLLAAPPQSNFSGGHVCRPVLSWGWRRSERSEGGRREEERERTADEKVGGIKGKGSEERMRTARARWTGKREGG